MEGTIEGNFIHLNTHGICNTLHSKWSTHSQLYIIIMASNRLNIRNSKVHSQQSLPKTQEELCTLVFFIIIRVPSTWHSITLPLVET